MASRGAFDRRRLGVAPGVLVVCAAFNLASVARAAGPAPDAPRRVAVLVVPPPRTSTKALSLMQGTAIKVVNRQGLRPSPAPLLERRLEAWKGAALPACFQKVACLRELRDHLEVDALLLLRVNSKGSRYQVAARLWHPRVDGVWFNGKAKPRRKVAAAVTRGVEVSVERFRKAWAKTFGAASSAEASDDVIDPLELEALAAASSASPAEPPVEPLLAPLVDPPAEPPAEPLLEPLAESSGASEPSQPAATETIEARSATATPIQARQEPIPSRVTLVGEEPSTSGAWGFQVGVAPALFPVQHRASPLSVGRNVGQAEVGTLGLGVALRLRIGGLPLEEFYITLWGAYAFDDPLVVFGLGPGVEKRWDLERWLPLVGARYALAMVGLPVPTAQGSTLAWAVNHGVEGYVGVGVRLDPVPLQLQLEVGYRAHPQRINQFNAGGTAYFSRDPTQEVWVVDLSGPTARLLVVFAWD